MNRLELSKLENEASKSIEMLTDIIADLWSEVIDLKEQVENLEAELTRYQEKDIWEEDF